MVIKRVFCCAMIVGFFLNLAGCNISKPPQPKVIIIPEETQLHHRVAILPFVNKTSDPNAGETVRKMFYNFFSSLNYLDVEPSIVDSTLKKKGLYKLAKELDFEIVDLTDVSIEEYVLKKEDILSKSKNSPFIGMSLKGRNICTIVEGRIVWSRDTEYTRS